MRKRLLVTATVTAGLLAAVGSGAVGAAPAPPASRPRPASAAWLYGAPLASASATNAWAVGHTAGKILILHWNGAKWVTVPAPSPAGAKPALLAGVSAVSSSAAWAVGEADYPHNVRKLLIERWDGTRWKLAPPRTRPHDGTIGPAQSPQARVTVAG